MSLLRSRFGRRLLILFVAATILPLGAAALLSLHNVTAQLTDQSGSRLRQLNRSFGLAVYERLLFVEADLKRLAALEEAGTKPLPPAVADSGLARRFHSISLQEASGPTALLLGTAVNPPGLDPEALRRLGAGGTVLVTETAASGAARLLLFRALSTGKGSGGLLVAEVNPDYLWGVPDQNLLAGTMDAVVLDGSGRVLFSTLRDPAPFAAAARRATLGEASGSFEETLAGRAFLGSVWSLFLKAGFGAPAWTVLLSEARSDVMAPMMEFKRTYLLVMLLCLSVILLLAHDVIRRSLDPLEALGRATRRIAQREFDSRVTITSGDEFQELGAAFNEMAEELGRQFTALRAEIVERERAEGALRESEEQLRQSQKLEAIGTLAGGVAHDFNNLLTVINSYTDLAIQDLPPGDPLREDLQEVREAGERATGLTRQLLAFSRKQVLQPTVLDLRGVVAATEKMLRRLIGEDIELRSVTTGDAPVIRADAGQIEQVLVNLAVNARDAMPVGGTLTIEIAGESGEPGWVRLSVTDSGSGMDEATQARIFEPFFTTKEPGKGTGLGLSTVYGIVKQSGGSISVRSRPGQGTRFTILLPGVEGDAAAEPEGPDSRLVVQGHETVLLVEDESAVRELAERVLQKNGYRVLVAGDGEEAVRLADRHAGPIHLVVTDVVMPRMSGKELVECLSASRPEARFLYTSGYTDDAIVRHGVSDLGRAFLPKPFSPDQLAQKVRRVLDATDEAVSCES